MASGTDRHQTRTDLNVTAQNGKATAPNSFLTGAVLKHCAD